MENIDSMLENKTELRKMSAASKLLGRPMAADAIAEMIVELARSGR